LDYNTRTVQLSRCPSSARIIKRRIQSLDLERLSC